MALRDRSSCNQIITPYVRMHHNQCVLRRCCDLPDGAEKLQWGSGEDLCRWENYMVPNYTDSAARLQAEASL